MNGAAVIQPAPIPFYTVLVLYLGIYWLVRRT